MNKLKFAGLVASLAVLGGCATTEEISDTDPGIMERPVDIVVPDTPPKEVIEIAEKNTVPTWFIDMPQDTEKEIYGAGAGLSVDLQFSLDKAMHQAKVILGDKLDNRVSSELKTYISDNSSIGVDNTISETQKVSKSGYKNVDVSKYSVIEKAVYSENQKFRTYVLLKVDPSNRRDHETTPIVINQAEIDKARESARASMDNL